MSGATYRIEEYDRLSILYDDARRALVEADTILAAAGGHASLRLGPATGAALAISRYLCDELDRDLQGGRTLFVDDGGDDVPSLADAAAAEQHGTLSTSYGPEE